MAELFMADDLVQEQIEYIENEFFAGFKRFGNWKSLLIDLSNKLPVFVKNHDILQQKFDNELENLLFIKDRLFVTYNSVINDRKSLSKFNTHYSNNKSSFNASIKKSFLESVDNLHELCKELLPEGFNIQSNDDACEQLITLFDKSLSKLVIFDGQLNNIENNIDLATSMINDFIDDKDGIRYKNVKKTDKEIDKEKETAKADAKRLAKLECSIHAHLSSDDEEERTLHLEKEFLDKISPVRESRVSRNKNECINYLTKYLNDNNNIIEDYQSHCSVSLKNIIESVQEQYVSDERPWVIGYSGGKDSSAVVSIVYFALLTLDEKLRTKQVYIVASDTLVETPLVVDHINKSLESIGNQAKRDCLPISTHKVLPKPDKTFWTCLLGKGYPAPTQSFRWCTERMKINPVSDFITGKVTEFEEVIVVLGSRSQESASRAQVIAKHKIANTRLARHTTLPNAFIYTPIDTWSMDDVWKSLRSCSLDVTSSHLGIGKKWVNKYELEWITPWGGKNLTLWNLYKDSSDQGECPMVIDDSTPSCGNSRFGCWTCTVVTRDRAMESLIQNGEEWMQPLLTFRNKLAETNVPENKTRYRNFKRRTGRVSYQRVKDGQDLATERDHVPGPYMLKFRKQWLKELLQQEKNFNQSGYQITLVTEPELHAIRQEWLKDPNEPDWADSLPQIYREVYEKDLDWVIDDNNSFGEVDAQILQQLGDEYDVSPEMIQKLLDLEVSLEGLSRRTGVFDKIGSLLKQDWGSLEEIKEKHAELQSKADFDIHKDQIKKYEDEIAKLDRLAKVEL